MTKFTFFFFVSLGSLVSLSASAACNTTTVESLAPDSRYVLQENDTEVWDKNTGLVWKRCAEGLSDAQCATGSLTAYNWRAAVELGNADWRLPNIKELASLVALECESPAINSTIFPGSPSGLVWSASPNRLNDQQAWAVDFQTGKVEPQAKNAGSTYVRLVKDK